MLSGKPRVVVCGTTFGRVYLAAFRDRRFPFELAGVLGRGSERSRACAEAYDVPLFDSVEALPADVDIACVVVRAGIVGGVGSELARALMARGIHVVQEHPLHHDELAENLRTARRYGVRYRLNTHYVHLPPVRRFIDTVRALAAHQRPLFADAAAGVQVACALFDILGRALGGLSPCVLEAPAAPSASSPFRVLQGSIAGVPLTLRIQNQLDPRDPDNGFHLMHRLCVGAEGGNLTLLNTHGPLYWSPRFHVSPTGAAAPSGPDKDLLAAASAEPIGESTAPSFHSIVHDLWPQAPRRALRKLWGDVESGAEDSIIAQYDLSLCRAWQQAMSQLGEPELIEGARPAVLSAREVAAFASDTETPRPPAATGMGD
ncbi:Gfo/Idh/MocA family oxidoreductase [Arhodomonas sp. AD133]|uniref:Gfo/Idh/MocA family oxidoreductase n=1 Tax=Arhodomonas sp. AD133 TaxID=3415009 RepID=UPI003EBB587C